jgi:hypothetical protein
MLRPYEPPLAPECRLDTVWWSAETCVKPDPRNAQADWIFRFRFRAGREGRAELELTL